MIDVIAAIARWFQLIANLILLGSCVFFAIASTRKRAYIEPWIEGLERTFPWLAISIPIGLVVILATTIVQVTGPGSNLWQPEVWLGIIKDTQAGQIWILRTVSSLLLVFVVIYQIGRAHV